MLHTNTITLYYLTVGISASMGFGVHRSTETNFQWISKGNCDAFFFSKGAFLFVISYLVDEVRRPIVEGIQSMLSLSPNLLSSQSRRFLS